MRRQTAACALAAFVLALVLPSLTRSHAWADADLAGVDAALFVGHPTTQIESPRVPVGPEHCALCHWLRSLGNSVVGGPVAVPVTGRLEHHLAGSTTSHSAVSGSSCPARAPPASPVA